MNAEILAVGTELLLGDILNTNAQFLSKELACLGINVYFQTVVGDNRQRLLSAVEAAFSRADLIITTGGLGPTNDDLTKEVIAEYFSLPLIPDEKALNDMVKRFSKLQSMPESNKKQALLPEGSKPLYNAWGTAPGCIIEKDGKMLVMLPGPPGECVPMFDKLVKPELEKKQEYIFFSRTLRLSGIGESAAAEKIGDMLDAQTNPTIAPYAKSNEVTFRITAKAKNEPDAKTLLDPVAEEIYRRLGEYIYGEGETTLEETVVRHLREKGLTIAVAESCTGGIIAAKLTDIPGASEVFTEGCVTYSNNSKITNLGVRAETLARFGAVSEECAAEMAQGMAARAKTDIALSVTGIAGPGGATEEKPVGLVYIGMYFKGGVTVAKHYLSGDRQRIRTRAVRLALDMIRKI